MKYKIFIGIGVLVLLFSNYPPVKTIALSRVSPIDYRDSIKTLKMQILEKEISNTSDKKQLKINTIKACVLILSEKIKDTTKLFNH